MALLPDNLRLTAAEVQQLAVIRQAALVRFQKFVKRERLKGRVDFPAQPYEFSWAFEEEFRRQSRRAVTKKG